MTASMRRGKLPAVLTGWMGPIGALPVSRMIGGALPVGVPIGVLVPGSFVIGGRAPVSGPGSLAMGGRFEGMRNDEVSGVLLVPVTLPRPPTLMSASWSGALISPLETM